MAKREAQFLPDVSTSHVQYMDLADYPVDPVGARLMERFVPGGHGSPLYSSPDGNCLFNALSIILFGNETKATELRLRTCIALLQNRELYEAHPSSKDIKTVSPDIEEACLDCCYSGAYSSAWAMMAAADATGVAIRSFYPCVNGPNDLVHKILHDMTFVPTVGTKMREVTILWTKVGRRGSSWTPNHFVPIRPDFHNAYESPEDMSIDEISLQEVSLQEEKEVEETFVSECSAEQDTDQSMGMAVSFANVSTSTQHNDDSDEDSSQDQPKLNALPNGGLDAESIHKEISERNYVHKEIPHGKKDNVYFLIDNARNLERKAMTKKNQFVDDLGVWDTMRGKTVTTSHVVMSDQTLKVVFLRDGTYCIQKMHQKRRMYIPLDPQPDVNDIIQIHKYYTVLKRQSNYKRRISWITAETSQSLGNVALVEYYGVLETTESSDGNAKNSEEMYRRTDPKVMELAVEKLKIKKPRQVYQEMVEEDSIIAPKHFQQLRDIKYREKVKSGVQHGNNIADDLLRVMDMLTSNAYVQKVEQSKNRVPTVFLYHDNQILDMVHFLKNAQEPRVGIDRTFNLGPFFATTFVYKHQKVVRKETQEHPIFLGPVMLHKEADYTVYHSFFSHIRARLAVGITDIDVRIPKTMEFGSDAEKALTKAIDDCFPNADRKLCTKQLKDNLSDYLKNRAGVTATERKTIVDKIFGEEGIVLVNDSFDFEEKCISVKDLATENTQFLNYFENHFKQNLLKYVVNPKGQKSWTNNNSESMNNILKLEIDWKPQNTVSLIEKIKNVIKLQFLDLKRSLLGNGNYRLFGAYNRFKISESAYRVKSKPEKDHILAQFLRADLKKTTPDFIQS